MNNNHGSVIKEIRKLRGISQQQLGQLIGSQSMVSRIENNKAEPSDHTLLLCHALNISFDEYFDIVYGTHASDTERLFLILYRKRTKLIIKTILKNCISHLCKQ